METLSTLQISISNIKPNPNNPRRVITAEMVDTLAASLKAVGLKNPIKLIALMDGTYEIVSGHIRFAGAQKLGWESIPAFVLALTPQQALLEAILDNRGQQMNWLETYMAAESLSKINPNLTQQAIGDQLGIDRAYVSRGFKILNLLSTPSRDAICENLTKLEGYRVSENAVYALTDLGEDLDQTLKVVLDRKMTEPQAKSLVAWVKAGNTPDSYKLSAQPKRAARPVASEQAADTRQAAPNTPKSLESPALSETPAQTSPDPSTKPTSLNMSKTTPDAMGTSAPSSHKGTQATKPIASAGGLSAGEAAAWDALAGISIIAQIKNKIKKGERPSFWEALLLAVHALWTGLVWLGKHAYKLAKPMAKFIWKLTKESLKVVLKALGRTVYNVVRAVLALAFLGLLAWFGWECYTNGFHPRAALMDIGRTLFQWAVLLWKQG